MNERASSRSGWFFVVMAFAVAAMVYLGFAPTYYARPPEREPLSALLSAHGLVYTGWIALFIVQASLARAGLYTVHKGLGLASLALAAAMVWIGLEAGRDAYARGVMIPGTTSPAEFYFLPWSDAFGFALLYGAAVLLRARGDWHKRLMLAAALSILLPATARFAGGQGLPPVLGVGLQLAFFLPLFAFDAVTLRRLHPATLAAFVFVVAKIVAIFTLAPTPAWAAFASWMAG